MDSGTLGAVGALLTVIGGGVGYAIREFLAWRLKSREADDKSADAAAARKRILDDAEAAREKLGLDYQGTAWRGIVHEQGEMMDTLRKEQRERIDKMEADRRQEVAGLDARITLQQAEIRDVGKELMECSKERTALAIEVAVGKTQMAYLSEKVRELQSKVGLGAPPTMLPGVVVTDARGVIKVASPALTPLLRWLPDDLRGKDVRMLIPELTGLLGRLCESEVTWKDTTLVADANVKGGGKMSVTVALTAWQVGKDWLVTAEIARVPSKEEP